MGLFRSSKLSKAHCQQRLATSGGGHIPGAGGGGGSPAPQPGEGSLWPCVCLQLARPQGSGRVQPLHADQSARRWTLRTSPGRRGVNWQGFPCSRSWASKQANPPRNRRCACAHGEGGLTTAIFFTAAAAGPPLASKQASHLLELKIMETTINRKLDVAPTQTFSSVFTSIQRDQKQRGPGGSKPC